MSKSKGNVVETDGSRQVAWGGRFTLVLLHISAARQCTPFDTKDGRVYHKTIFSDTMEFIHFL